MTSAKQKIVNGRGPSNLNLGISLIAPLMFVGIHSYSPLLSVALFCNMLRVRGFSYQFLVSLFTSLQTWQPLTIVNTVTALLRPLFSVQAKHVYP